MGINDLKTPNAAPIVITDPNLGGSAGVDGNMMPEINITDANVAMDTAKAIEITDPNLRPDATRAVGLSDLAGKELDRERVQKAIDGIDSTGAREVDGKKIITPDMIPNIPDPDAPKPRFMKEEEMSKLHSAIDRKQAEYKEAMDELRAQSEANKKILEARGVKFDEHGNPIGDINLDEVQLTEEEDMEAALDAEIRQETKSRQGTILIAPGAPMSDPNHELEEINEDEFAELMREDDKVNGNFYDQMAAEKEEQQASVQQEAVKEEPKFEKVDAHVEVERAPLPINEDKELAEAEREFMEAAEATEAVDVTAPIAGVGEVPTVEVSGNIHAEPIQPEERVKANVETIISDETKAPEEVPAPKPGTMATPFVVKEENGVKVAGPNLEDLEKELKEAEGSTEAEEDLSEEEMEKEMEAFTKQVSEAFDLAPNHINLSGFKVGAPVSAKSVLASLPNTNDSSDWALSTSGIPISMRKFTGTELRDLASYASGRRNRLNTVTERYKMLYDHDTNPYKPDTVEAWAKTINATDNDDMYFCVYDATFHNANHIPYNCSCGHSWISDHIPTSEMVRFEDPEFEKEFMEIREKGHYKGEFRRITKKVVPVTDQIAVGIKNADLYDINFVYRLVGETFYEKYKDTLQLFPFIDEFYYINQATGTLQPIATEDRSKQGDLARNVKNRVIIFNRFIKSLDTDAYNVLIAAAGKPTDENEKKVSYVIPSAVCPKCGKVIEEVKLDGTDGNSMENQLFTRRPLALIVNT